MILLQPVFLRSVILAVIFAHTLRPCVQINYGKEIMWFFFTSWKHFYRQMGVTYKFFAVLVSLAVWKINVSSSLNLNVILLIFLGLGAKPKELSLRTDSWIYKKTFFFEKLCVNGNSPPYWVDKYCRVWTIWVSLSARKEANFCFVNANNNPLPLQLFYQNIFAYIFSRTALFIFRIFRQFLMAWNVYSLFAVHSDQPLSSAEASLCRRGAGEKEI